ncbi:iron-sulfur cluster assembly accessory protein [Kitasatospora sp. NPDC093102]|uniref:HesB/IscA family protein n=1 Tax=Kitasatospora sp. NPDC093102 TaxID=3155069 RepID=UPI0034345BF3
MALTEAAAAKIETLLAQEGEEGLALRFFVSGGGASGPQYGLTLDNQQDGDVVKVCHGVQVVVDSMSAGYIEGTVIDYRTGDGGEGFVVDNPNTRNS